MASVPKNYSSTTESKPIHDPANAPLFDYIHQSAKTIQRTELTVGILTWMVLGLVTVLAFVLIDQWVWPFSDFARYSVWLVLVVGSLYWLIRRVIPFLGRSINPEYAAKRIEDTIPEMKDGLISWLQLASRESTPRGVLNTVGRYVAKHLQGQEVASVIDQFTSMKLAATLFGLVLISAIYLAVSPKSGVVTISRLLMPWANISPSTRVQILLVSPGHATVSEGSSLRIAVQVRGWNRGDVTQIRYATDDGQTSDKTVVMLSEIEGLTYFTDLGKGLGGIVQPMKYFVESGDAKAGPFAIKIQAVPLVLLEQVEYIYPAYTRLAPRTTEGDGRIEAPEGTRVTIRARSNQLMKKSRIEFDSNPGKENTFHVTSVDDVLIDNRTLAAELLLELNEAKSNPTLLNYRILAANTLGEENAEPIVYPIKVIPDLAPEVQLASDLKDSIELPVNQKLNLEVRASDPDFGLVRLAISGMDGNQSVVAKELFRNTVGSNGLISEVYTLDPQLLRLRAGSQLDLFATAEDNRTAIGSDQPEPNVRQSRTIRVTITQPSQKTPDVKADKTNSTASQPKSEPGDAKSEKENAKNPSQETQSPKNKDSAKPEGPTKKDEGKKDEGKKDEGKKDEGKKDEGKSDEGKSEGQPQKDSPKKPDKAGEEGKSSKAESQSGSEKNPKNSPEDNKKEKTQSGGSQEENKPDPNDAKQGKSEQGKQQNDPSKQNKPQEGQSGAGESGAGQSGAGQSGAGEKQGGQSSSGEGGGSESSSGQGNDSGSPNANGNPESSRGSSQRDEPKHDGEVFEELKEMLKGDADSGETKGQGQSTKSDSNEKNSGRSSTPNEPTSGQGTPSDTQNPAGSSDPNNSKKDATGKPTKDSSKSGNENSSSNQTIDPKNDSTQDGKNGDKTKNEDGTPSTSDSQDNRNPSEKSGNSTSKGIESQSGKGEQSKGGKASSEKPTSNKQTDPSEAGPTENSTKASPGSESQTGGQRDQQGNSKSQNSDGKVDKPSSSNGEKGSSSGEQATPNGENGSTNGEKGSTNGENGTSNAEKGTAKQPSNSQGEKGNSAGDQQGVKSKSQDGGAAGDQPGDVGTSKESSSKSGSQSKNSTGNRSGKNSSGSDSNTGENLSGEQASPPESSVAETEYARQATDMVLKALDRQRDQPDPELLKRMGWSKEQMKAFLDRWKNARDQAASDPKKKRDYDEALRSLGLIPSTGKSKTVQGRDDQLRGLNEEGSRVRPPEALREPFEAFRRSTIPK